MTELEEVYDQKFDAHKRNLDVIYLDALETLYGFKHQYLADLKDNFTIIPPSTEFAEQLVALVEGKRYKEIFGEALGGNHCIFDPFGILELKLDSLHVFEFPPSDWLKVVSENQLTLKKHIQAVRQELGPRYPDKIKGYTVVIADMKDPNGKKVELTTYDDIEGKNLESLFKQYADWFAKHTEKLSPEFQSIADEISDWLVSDYKIKPGKDGFINWFMMTKMKAGITINAVQNENGLYDIEFGFDMLQDGLTPAVFDQDLHEYCLWRQNSYKKARQLDSIELTENAKLYLSKTPYKTFEELAIFFEQETEKYYKSSLADLQNVLTAHPDKQLTILENALKVSFDLIKQIDDNKEEYYPIIDFGNISKQEIIDKLTGPISESLCYFPKEDNGRHFFWQMNRLGVSKVIQYIKTQLIKLVPELPSLNYDFGRYIVEEHRSQLMPYLINKYKGKKPKQFGYMLYALDTLELLEKGSLSRHTELHLALTSSFEDIGTRQRLQQLISELAQADSNEEANIRQHVDEIKRHLVTLQL